MTTNKFLFNIWNIRYQQQYSINCFTSHSYKEFFRITSSLIQGLLHHITHLYIGKLKKKSETGWYLFTNRMLYEHWRITKFDLLFCTCQYSADMESVVHGMKNVYLLLNTYSSRKYISFKYHFYFTICDIFYYTYIYYGRVYHIL